MRAESSQAAPAEAVHRFLVLDCTLPFSSHPDLSLLAISAKSMMGRGSHVIPAETMHKFLLIDRHRTVLTAANNGTTQELNTILMTYIPLFGNILY